MDASSLIAAMGAIFEIQVNDRHTGALYGNQNLAAGTLHVDLAQIQDGICWQNFWQIVKIRYSSPFLPVYIWSQSWISRLTVHSPSSWQLQSRPVRRYIVRTIPSWKDWNSCSFLCSLASEAADACRPWRPGKCYRWWYVRLPAFKSNGGSRKIEGGSSFMEGITVSSSWAQW